MSNDKPASLFFFFEKRVWGKKGKKKKQKHPVGEHPVPLRGISGRLKLMEFT